MATDTLNIPSNSIINPVIPSVPTVISQNLNPDTAGVPRLLGNDLSEDISLLFGELDDIGKILQTGFSFKQQMAKNIATPSIIKFYETAIQAGATGGKISGAGGGGFMFFYCPNNTKDSVTKALSILGGNKQPFTFTADGLLSWTETN